MIPNVVFRGAMNTADLSDLSESDNDSPLCPLCYGPMDKTDLALFPCPCNFQVLSSGVE